MSTIHKVTIRKRVHEILEAADVNDRPSQICDTIIIIMILANLLAVVFGSVYWIREQYGAVLDRFEIFSGAVFYHRIWFTYLVSG